MKIIFLSRYSSKLSGIQLGLSSLITGVVSVVVLVSGVSLWAGFQFGKASDQQAQGLSAEAMQSIFSQERRELDDLQARTQEHLDALALRMGSMQAHVLRLDALGERLTQLGKLDNGEFNFDEEPPLGGRSGAEAADQGQTAPDLLTDLERLAGLIEDREQKLSILEDLIMNRRLQREVYPAGRPVKSGWISSYYGKRTDPFTGKKAMHKGVDFAGRMGSDVIAVAAGVVTRVGAQAGYGELVEIHHGNGYATRYAHNSKVLVDEGERVTQGQTIAKMGSSGRSTGPHVHFEVLRNGRMVNPASYVQASR